MARVTVEDCLEKVDNHYDLVLLAKERTNQLNSGAEPKLPEENDKRTVIALREIAEGKIIPEDLQDTAINKLRKYPEESPETENLDEVEQDDFEKIYKGEVSKSGTAILPSKRVRKVTPRVDLLDDKNEPENLEKENEENDNDLQKNLESTEKSEEENPVDNKAE